MRPEQYDIMNESIQADHERITHEFICYGQATWNIDALVDDVVKDRIMLGQWPTRDRAAPEEEC